MKGWIKPEHEVEDKIQMLTLAETSPKELVAFWADTWEFARLVYTLVLTKVTRETALVYVCVKNKEDSIGGGLNRYAVYMTQKICAWAASCISHLCRWIRLAPARNPAHSGKGKCHRCYNTSDYRGRPCCTRPRLKPQIMTQQTQIISMLYKARFKEKVQLLCIRKEPVWNLDFFFF